MEHRIRVRPEDLYNEQTILAAQEGRLFIDLKTDTIDRETINNKSTGGQKPCVMESGFANETTFYRVFKSTTGLTPSEWLSKQ